jgi:hypothetical protein
MYKFRRRIRRRLRALWKVLVPLVILAGLVGSYVVWQSSKAETGPFDEAAMTAVHAEGLQRSTIYHSPETPGYTAFVGAWIEPDGSLMTSFTQATGPVDPAARELAPESVKQVLGVSGRTPMFDFWGLDLSVLDRRSTDGGATWNTVRTTHFKAVYPNGYAPQPTIALRDGSILRRVNGWDLMPDPTVPHTAFLQRLDRGQGRWSAPQVLMDPARYTYQVGRIRRLRDDRLIATGNYWEAPAGTPHDQLLKAPNKLLLMASDDEGRTWHNALFVPSGNEVLPQEWDTAELPNGNLLAVFRTADPSNPTVPIRKQGVLEKRGAGWVLTDVRNAPFPHSGHPELLATREGVVLYIADTGVQWTADGGETWKPLQFAFPTDYRSMYYPRSVQAADGTIYIFSHVGSDDPYGAVDQSIVMDKFRLVMTPPVG